MLQLLFIVGGDSFFYDMLVFVFLNYSVSGGFVMLSTLVIKSV